MRPSFKSFALTGLAAVTLVGGLAACGSSGGSTIAAIPATGIANNAAQAAGSAYALGWVHADEATIASLPQFRQLESVPALPKTADLTAKMPPVGNQGSEGSCASWSSAYAVRGYEARRDVWASITPSTTDPTKNFSPAFTYNQVNGGRDAGSTIPAVLTLMQQKGAATLADMPYINGQYTTKPSASAFADALNYKLGTFGYIAPTNLTAIKTQLAAGIPVLLGFEVYNNFFALKANAIYTATGGGLAGGHAVAIVGYDDTKQAFKIQNSWGPYWATNGFGWIAYSVMPKIAVEAYSAVDSHGAPTK